MVSVTRLTAQVKSNRNGARMHSALRKVKNSTGTKQPQTCFAGKGTLTKEELAQDLQYAQSVCRQKFW